MTDFFAEWFDDEPGYSESEAFKTATEQARKQPVAGLIDDLKTIARNGDPYEVDAPVLLAAAERLADSEWWEW